MEKFVDFFLAGLFSPGIWVYVLCLLVFTHITIAAVTIFLHRCQAHRSVVLHPVVSHFFRLWLWLTTGMVTREWAAVHRKHHAKAETPEDPHSPQVHGLASVLWGGVIHYIRAKKDPETIRKYGYGTPDDWVENHLYSKYPAVGVVIMAVIDVFLFGFVPGMLIFTVQMIWIPFWAAGVINGIGHYWGYRNFQPKDESRNIVPIGLVIGGEELHNNHHAFPTSARLSNRWYEFDVGWLYIRLMEKCGLAKVKRVAPRLLSSDSRAACDLDTLQSIIANRLEVISRFTKSTRHHCQQELKDFCERFGAKDAPPKKAVENWLQGMHVRLSSSEKQGIRNFIEHSPMFAKVEKMRAELVSLWEDRSATPEVLLERLKNWCAEAEKSGIAALANFSYELRGFYTADPRPQSA